MQIFYHSLVEMLPNVSLVVIWEKVCLMQDASTVLIKRMIQMI